MEVDQLSRRVADREVERARTGEADRADEVSGRVEAEGLAVEDDLSSRAGASDRASDGGRPVRDRDRAERQQLW